jgi:hypothetical protein
VIVSSTSEVYTSVSVVGSVGAQIEMTQVRLDAFTMSTTVKNPGVNVGEEWKLKFE